MQRGNRMGESGGMRKAKGSIFDYNVIVIPTCKNINSKGELVMGAGLAKEAKTIYPGIEKVFAKYPAYITLDKILINFQTKEDWRQPSSLATIEESLKQLIKIPHKEVALPLVGCGLGGLRKEDVVALLDEYLDDRFILIEIR